MKKWLLKKQEKDYFTSAQIILTCPFFLNYYSALALVSSTLFGNILNHSSSYTKGNWRERQNGRRDEWKIHSPSLSLCVSHTRGVCVCVFVNEAPASMKAARRRMKENNNHKSFSNGSWPNGGNQFLFQFPVVSIHRFFFCWPSRNELAVCLLVNSVLCMSSFNIMRRDLDCWHSLRCVGVDRTQNRPFQFP